MQRRTLLKLGVTGSAALALVGGGVALFYEPAWRVDRLTGMGRTVFEAVARAVLDGSLPVDAAALRSALASHLERIDGTLRAMAPATQREVADLLALLALPPGRIALAGLTTDWAYASVAQVHAALQSMRTSRLTLRRQAYHALRDLTHAAYFADSATWTQLGYPGPVKLG
jgi:hypothetical protein